MIEVKFQYDEQTRKWDPLVVGTDDAAEAFAAVVLTCQMLDPQLLQYTQVIKTPVGYKVVPAV